ncbi:MAG: recombinase family protein, partial [Planktothrix sp.]
PQAVSGLNLPDLQIVKHGIIQEINQKQEILLQITDLLTSGILDLETAELRRYKLRIEISQLQGKLAELPPVNLKETAQAVCITQFWLDLSETERRFYFREFIKTIEIIRDGDNWELKLVFIF